LTGRLHLAESCEAAARDLPGERRLMGTAPASPSQAEARPWRAGAMKA